jgi:hypothetical protein
MPPVRQAKVVLENHSALIFKETRVWVAEQPTLLRIHLHFQARFWAQCEGFFSKLAHSALRHIRAAAKQKLKDHVMATLDYFNQKPVIHTLSFKLDKTA